MREILLSPLICNCQLSTVWPILAASITAWCKANPEEMVHRQEFLFMDFKLSITNVNN